MPRPDDSEGQRTLPAPSKTPSWPARALASLRPAAIAQRRTGAAAWGVVLVDLCAIGALTAFGLTGRMSAELAGVGILAVAGVGAAGLAAAAKR